MPKKANDYRRKDPKKGCYKRRSRKAILKKARLAKNARLLDQNLENPDKIHSSNFKSFRRKIFSGFVINRLKSYQKTGRTRHLVQIEDLIPGLHKNRESEPVVGMLVLSFLVSPEYIEQLDDCQYPKVFICNKFPAISNYEIDQPVPSRLMIHPPQHTGRSIDISFHPKLILIKHEKSLKLIAGTGNLINCDWVDYANAFFIKKLELRNSDNNKVSHQLQQLKKFIEICMGPFANQGMKFVNMNLEDYSWDCPEFQFLYSLPGTIDKECDFKYSYFQLAEIVRSNSPQIAFSVKNLTAYYISSSLGVLSQRLICDFLKCFLNNKFLPKESENDFAELIEHRFRVIYPTRRYIDGTYLGSGSSQSLFLKKSLFETFSFKRSVLCKYRGNQSVAGNNQVTPHLKAFIITNQEEITDDTIVYIGSANFTVAAWGRKLIQDSKLECFNYELGMLFASRKGTANAKKDLLKKLGVDIAAEKYESNDEPYFN